MAKAKKDLVTREQLDSILAMLESTDEDTQILGGVTLDSIDFNTNLAELLCFLKLKPVKISKTTTPKLYKNIIKAGLEDYLKNEYLLIEWGKLINYFRDKDVPEHFDIFIKYFEEYTKESLVGVGYDFIETLTITVKKKDE